MRLRRRKSDPEAAPAPSVAPTDGAPGTASTAVAETPADPPTESPAVSPTVSPAGPPADPAPTRAARRRPGIGQLGPVLLLRAAHPKQAVATAVGVAVAAALADRPARELLLVLGTVLVGQAMAGWLNDLVDRKRDEAVGREHKPLVDGSLDPGTVWFAFACAALLVVPLALSNGLVAGASYLCCLAVTLIGTVVLRRGWFSWVSWAASYALYPAFLSYGGWGGSATGAPPEVAITALAAGLGVCVHVLRALPGLVDDNHDGQKHLPLRIALRTGAPALLWITLLVTAGVLAGLVVAGSRVGLAQ